MSKQCTISRRILVALFCIFTGSGKNSLLAQGRFLRGEEKVAFELKSAKADFYVSVKGNDRWSGRLPEPNKDGSDGPFATLFRAQRAVREYKRQIYFAKKPPLDPRFKGSPHVFGKGNDILVLLRQGVYTLDSTLMFSAEDGGERVETDLPTGAFEYHKLKDYYVTYAAYPGEKAVISGGQRIEGWKQGEKGVWEARPLSGQISEVFVGGKRQRLARTPNSGYFATDGQPTDPAFFKFHEGHLKNWPGLESNRITMVVRWGSIASSLVKIDEKSRLAYLEKPDKELLNVPPKYYVENVRALLDTAGEWFYSKKDNVLSLIPEGGIKNPDEAVVTTPKISGLIAVNGSREKPVRNLRFYNLAFTTTSPGGEGSLSFKYAKNCEVIGNTIENVSQTAIRLSLGCYNNLISKNKIHDVTGGGIAIVGQPIPEHWSDVVKENTVTFNEVEMCRPARVGIATANALNTRIAHNYVSNTGSYGITVGSWPNVEETSDGNHLVEFNHVSFTNMVRDDEGGIAVYGLSPGSLVRKNVIHDVHPAATNENVGLFFQNMSSGWTVTDNIYYNLKQAEMKLCACYLVDNKYEGNQKIETPVKEAERIIVGDPDFLFSDLNITAKEGWSTGKQVEITARIKNVGSTGHEAVNLYVDGKVAETISFPVVAGNERVVRFNYQFFDPGKHIVAIGSTPVREVTVTGKAMGMLMSDLSTPLLEVPAGDSVIVYSKLKNVRPDRQSQKVGLIVDGKSVAVKERSLKGGESENVRFSFVPSPGIHLVTIGNQVPVKIRVYKQKLVSVSNADFSTYCSATAQPCEYDFDVKKNQFRITAKGTDFLHAEDSYGAIFLKKAVKGNFVATVRLVKFGENVSDWFRVGLFVRNDLTQSGAKGSKGAFLAFSTPKRIGAQWDEFGSGSMHNSKSQNYTGESPFPVWLKLVRHGDRFSSYYSKDGKDWLLVRESGALPGLSETMDIGMAAGSNDQRSSEVVFSDFQLHVEE